MARLRNILGLLILVIAANWPLFYSEVSSETNGALDLYTTDTSLHCSTTLAGWPFRYYQASDVASDKTLTSFSWTGLWFNVAAWSMVAVAGIVYEKYITKLSLPFRARDDRETETDFSASLEKEQKQTANPAKKVRLRLSDLFVATALVASILGYWGVINQRAAFNRNLSEIIVSNGGATTSTALMPWVPAYVMHYVGYKPFLRLSTVQLQSPDDEILEKVVRLPHLQSLSLFGGNYSFQPLKRLSTNPLLRHVAIVGRELDSNAISVIRSLPHIRHLNLMRTNITAEGVNAVGHPQLEELNLVRTDVKLADFAEPVFSKNLRVLHLPHPAKGSGDSLVLEGWPNLTVLTCHEDDEFLNDEPVSLTLKNLPKLESVELDALQLFDLEIENTPNLSRVIHSNKDWRKRTSPSQIVPSGLWTRKTRIAGAPLLKDLLLFPLKMEATEIDIPSLNLKLKLFNNNAIRTNSKHIGRYDKV